MKLTVFGASGLTGRQIVRQALDADHDVTAVVRDPAKIDTVHPRLTVVQADVFEPATLAPVIAGRDAVVSALGAHSRGPTVVCERGVRSIGRAMNSAGVRRLVVVSNSAHTPTTGDSALRRLFMFGLGQILKNPFADLRRMESEIRRSGLDWTVLQPSRMTNGIHTGRYRTVHGGHVPAGWSIARADVADAALRALTDDDAIGDFVGIAY